MPPVDAVRDARYLGARQGGWRAGSKAESRFASNTEARADEMAEFAETKWEPIHYIVESSGRAGGRTHGESMMAKNAGAAVNRRQAALGAGGLAAALLGPAGKEAGARKKDKKPKPAPKPLAFMSVAIVEAAFSGNLETPGVNWRVNGFCFHPPTTIRASYVDTVFQTPADLAPEKVRAALTRSMQIDAAENLDRLGAEGVPPERIAVTIL